MTDDADLRDDGGSHRGAGKGSGSGSSWKAAPQTFLMDWTLGVTREGGRRVIVKDRRGRSSF